MTAPLGDVTTPITSGRNGKSCLRASSNRPSAASFFLRSSRSAISAPTPAGSSVSTTIWYFDEPANVVSRPETMTSRPSSRLDPHAVERGLPDHRFQHRPVVLEAEIDVAGGRGAAEARHLAAHPHIAIGVLDGLFQRRGQFGNRPFGNIGERRPARRTGTGTGPGPGSCARDQAGLDVDFGSDSVSSHRAILYDPAAGRKTAHRPIIPVEHSRAQVYPYASLPLVLAAPAR